MKSGKETERQGDKTERERGREIGGRKKEKEGRGGAYAAGATFLVFRKSGQRRRRRAELRPK